MKNILILVLLTFILSGCNPEGNGDREEIASESELNGLDERDNVVETETGYEISSTEKSVSTKKRTTNTEKPRTEKPETEQPEIEREEKVFSVSETLKLTYETNIPEPEYEISDSDYEKYNVILDYLNTHYDKSEDVLFEELSIQFGESAEDLRQFTMDNMQTAINRDLNKGSGAVGISDTEIDKIVRDFLDANLTEPYSRLRVDSNTSAKRSIIKGTFYQNDYSHDYILKIEFTDDLKAAEVYQFKINGINIDLE